LQTLQCNRLQKEGTTMKFWTKVKQYPRLGLILLAFIAFVALGMPDGLLGVG
jgi:hypothetical protein